MSICDTKAKLGNGTYGSVYKTNQDDFVCKKFLMEIMDLHGLY